jgi:hypothetical protein
LVLEAAASTLALQHATLLFAIVGRISASAKEVAVEAVELCVHVTPTVLAS